MPIDYFAPEYYNSLQPCLRHYVTNAKVSLLPDINLSFSGMAADEKLTNEAFNKKYGAQVLTKYNLPDEAEFEAEDEWLAEAVEEDEYDDNDDNDC